MRKIDQHLRERAIERVRHSKFEYLFAMDLSRIILRACEVIGVNPETLFPDRFKDNFEKLTVTEWFEISRKLHLSSEAPREGYSEVLHLLAVRAAILRGDYQLPVNEKLQARIRAAETVTDEIARNAAQFAVG